MANEEVVDEFTVDVSKVDLIEHYRKQIQGNFNVEIWYGLIFQFHAGDKQWVNMKGQYNDRSIAKEYIKALCNPQETLGIPFPSELRDIVTNRTLLQKLEKKTRAAILIDNEKCELSIQGSDVAVTLALSVIEELISGHQKGMMDSHTSPSTYVRQASVRLEHKIRRLWSQDDTIVDDEDITKMPDQVKRAILSCFAENEQGLIMTDREHGEEKTISTHTHLNVCDKNKKKQGYSLSNVESEMDNLNLNCANASKGFKSTNHLKQFALQNGYKEEEISEVLFRLNDEKTSDADFLIAMNHNRTLLENSKQTCQAEAAWPDPPPVLDTNGLQVQNRHLLSYFSQLSKDFVEEDSNCSVDEFKRRNAERQKILHEAIKEKGRVTEENTQQSNHPRSKQRQGKKKKQLHPIHTGGMVTPISPQDKGHFGYRDQQKHQSQTQQYGSSQPYLREGLNDKNLTGVTHTASQSMSTHDISVASHHHHHAAAQLSESYPLFIAGNIESTGNCHQKFTPKQSKAVNVQQISTIQQQLSPPATGIIGSPVNVGVGIDEQDSDDKRYIVIDGSNVAMTHGNGKIFSCRGIQLCVDYFVKRGHMKITVFVPNWRKGNSQNSEILFDLQERNQLVFTPSRKIKGKNIACYDDRFIVRLADEMDGVIVSNDQYRDLMVEREEWRKIIEERLLQYSFVGDFFMPPDDPLGQDGPSLEEFLSRSTNRKFKTRNIPQNQMQHTSRRLFTNEVGNHNSASQPQRQSPWRRHNSPHALTNPNVKRMEGFTELKGVAKRTLQQTETLLKQLLVIFPENIVNVKKVLQNHTCETDLNKLSTYILNID